MAAGKTTFVLEADEAKAVAAYLKVSDAQKQNIDNMRRMNRESQQTSKVMDSGFRAVASTLGLLSIPAAFIQQVRSVIAELEKAVKLRKEMGETALTVEQLGLKIAQLRGDVTKGGVAAVTKDMAEISKQAAVSLEVASKSLFYAESAMGAGTARAKSAAMAISKFAGPAGLTPEETMLIPKLFDIMRADTNAKQMQILNQLNAATIASIAETGAFIAPFMKPLVSDIQRGFTLPQSLARMVAAIQVTGSVEEAGTISATALDIAAGRTEQALKYYRRQARRKGVDYGTMTDPERYEFARSLYEEAAEAGPGAMDVMKTKVGAKGFRAIRAIFGETGKRKYFEVMPDIEAAINSTIVEQLANQYLNLMTAESTQMTARKQITEALIGEKGRPGTVLEDMVEEILKQSKESKRGWGEHIGWNLPYLLSGFSEKFHKHGIARSLIEENLLTGLKNLPRGTAQYGDLMDLLDKLSTITSFDYSINPEYIRRAYQATEGFTLLGKYGYAYGPLSKEPSAGRAYQIYGRGMESYFEIDNKETIENQTEALKNNTEAIDRLSDRIFIFERNSGIID